MSDPIAYVRADRQLALCQDGTARGLTLAPGADGVVWGTWAHMGASLGHSWPTFSPDGKWIACFQVPLTAEAGEQSAALVVDRRGVSEERILEQSDVLPIYLQWSPDGRALAVLAQNDEHLVLSVVARDRPGQERILARGSPLFFTWLPDGRLAAFVGGLGREGAVTIFDLSGQAAMGVPLPGAPGNFCAPVCCGDRIFYVCEASPDEWMLRAVGIDGDEVVDIERCEGLVALVADPSRTHLVRAVAPRGDGSPYQQLARIDAHTLERTPVWEGDCLAYLLSPGAESLVVATVDTRANLIRLHDARLDGSAPTEFHSFHPSRDMGFYLRYFEQFTQSHPLVSPDGTEVVIAGTTPEEGPRGEPVVWRVPVDGREPVAVDEGVFGVFGPA